MFQFIKNVLFGISKKESKDDVVIWNDRPQLELEFSNRDRYQELKWSEKK